MARTSAAARRLIDHEEIRRWAEDRGARPAHVSGTGGGDDVGMIRLDFPGYSAEGSLEEIGWDEWFDKFDESKLALMVQDETSEGKTSNFNKLVSLDTTQPRQASTRGASGSRASSRGSRAQGRSRRGRRPRAGLGRAARLVRHVQPVPGAAEAQDSPHGHLRGAALETCEERSLRLAAPIAVPANPLGAYADANQEGQLSPLILACGRGLSAALYQGTIHSGRFIREGWRLPRQLSRF
jgi:hypothetical protein